MYICFVSNDELAIYAQVEINTMFCSVCLIQEDIVEIRWGFFHHTTFANFKYKY